MKVLKSKFYIKIKNNFFLKNFSIKKLCYEINNKIKIILKNKYKY
jgi:hypothetical protein